MKWSVFFLLFRLTNAYSSEPKRLFTHELSEQAGRTIGRFKQSVEKIDPLAGSQVNLLITLETLVDLGLGSSITFAGSWLHQLDLQRSDPEGDNYIEYQQENGSVSFEQKEVLHHPVSGMQEVSLRLPVYSVRSTPIDAGTILKFRIRKVSLPKIARQNFVVRPLVQLSEDQSFLALPGLGIDVIAGKLAQIRLIADSIARPGEDINLRLRLEDQFGNLTSNHNLSLDLLINGQFQKRISLTEAYTPIPNVRLKTPGLYELEVRTGGGGLRAVSNPVLVSLSETKVTWLSIGKHTLASGGVQQQSEILRSNLGIFDKTLMADAGPSSSQLEFGIKGSDNTRRGVFLEGRSGKLIGIALAEAPTDIRYFDPDSLNLIQTTGPASDYLWFGDAAAKRGYRVGFVAYEHSLQFPGVAEDIYTGLMNKRGDDWFGSLAAGKTFISVGEKILLLVERSKFIFNERRELQVEVVAANPIASVELYKNGIQLIRHTSGIIDESTYTLTLRSSNQPLSGLETKPRNRREWIGFLATMDSEIEPETTRRNWLMRQAGNKRFDFLTWLHGGSRQLNFKLEKTTPDTMLEIRLAEIVEDAAWLPEDRTPQEISSQLFFVPMTELQGGAVREFEVAGYRDQIEVRPAVRPGEKTQRHSFIDPSPPRIGDYYYVKAVLSNGAYAYTSPIFVEK